MISFLINSQCSSRSHCLYVAGQAEVWQVLGVAARRIPAGPILEAHSFKYSLRTHHIVINVVIKKVCVLVQMRNIIYTL